MAVTGEGAFTRLFAKNKFEHPFQDAPRRARRAPPPRPPVRDLWVWIREL